MRHFACRFLAASSAACLALAASAATRPRYGGTLQVEIQARLSTFDPAESPDVVEAEALGNLRELIFDRLVRLDPKGQPQPGLALSWEHDAQAAKWRFKLRPGVKWQDGAPLTAEEVVTALEGHVAGASARLAGDLLEIDAVGPSPGLLATLATDASLSIRRPAVGTPPLQPDSAGALPIGTGPFRLSSWEPGRRTVLQANEDYWDGRPYVDSIEIQMGRASRDELLDLELGKADVVELDPVEARRAQREGKKIWASAAVGLLCLRFSPNRPAVQDRRLRLALADSIDRAAIQKFLLQNYGDVAGSIFPQWLSGYAFLFPTEMNLDHARQLRGEIGLTPTLTLGYDLSDALARQTAGRVAVNARDAGITLQVTPLPEGWRRMSDLGADLLVQRARIDGPTLGKAALEAAASLGFPLNAEPDRAEQTYAAERECLDTMMAIPLIHIPELLGVGPRVMDWSATPRGAWHLEGVSLEENKP
jgi:peptide/nickel transport system substrate-binding protein